MIKDINGKRFGRLLVTSMTVERRKSSVVWECRCDCGSVIRAKSSHLVSGQTRSCGCLQRDTVSRVSRGNVPANRLGVGEASRNALFYKYKKSAHDRGYEFSITRKEFDLVISQECFYCGKPPSQVYHGTGSSHGGCTYSGIDRSDNSLGYVTGNVLPCCRECNVAKGTRSYDDFVSWVRQVYKRRC